MSEYVDSTSRIEHNTYMIQGHQLVETHHKQVRPPRETNEIICHLFA
jgi:hypothetical protein